MSATENRIVKMIFDNASFKKGATDTKSQLADLDAAVGKAGNNKGLLNMGSAMEAVQIKASKMSVAVASAIGTIVSKATAAGLNMAKSLTLDPLKQGFDEYELKMKSIQTILSNTKGENLKSVTGALNELNDYADKTIYNFANMTQNIGKLTTAGVSLGDATATVKGFSNMVALAGGDANAAAGAMEQFGQGIQAGVIKLIDWKSLQTRGLGSQSLQKAFFETARAAGALKDVPLETSFEEWSKAQGGFNQSLESGWLTADTAVETMSIMAGEITTVKELMDKGFSKDVAEDMLEIAKNAEESATKVRTFSAFWGTLQEQIGSGWSQVIETVVGDFDEATNLFTSWSDATGNAIGKVFGYLSRLLNGWDKMGGRIAMIQAFKNVLAPIGAILGVIAKAWKAAFPGKKTGGGLAAASKGLEMITRPLMWLAKLIQGATPAITSFFKLFHVGVEILKAGAGWITDFAKKIAGLVNIDLGGSGGGFIDFVKKVGSAIGSAIDQVDRLLRKGASLREAFSGAKVKLPSMPDMPDMPAMPSLPSIGGMFGGAEKETGKLVGLTSGLKGLTSSVDDFNKADGTMARGMMFNPDAELDTSRVSDASDSAREATNELIPTGEELESLGDMIMRVLGNIKRVIGEYLSGASFDDLMASFNIAVLSVFVIRMSQMFKAITDGVGGFSGAMEGIEGALKSFTTNARAKLILNIAIAIGILAVSMWILSRIPAKRMASALAALSGIMLLMKVSIGGLVKSVEAMDRKGSALKLAALGLALLALAAAVLVLTAAFILMRFVKWEDLLKGLLTITLVLAAFQQMGKLAEHAAKNMAAAALAIGIVSASMILLAGALILFQFVKWESMAKAGLVLLAITAAIAALAMIPYGGIAMVGVAMLATSAGMLALANALIIFGFIKWESIGKAAVMLTVLAAAVGALMYIGGGPVGAATILAMAGAMIMLAIAGVMINKVKWETIGKIAVMMTVLIVAFAAFLAIISFFAPALILLSAFAGSIALLALALTGLMVAFAVMMPLLAAGVGAFAAFGTGAAIAMAVFVQTLAAEAPIIKKAMLDILQTIIDAIVEAVPMIIDGIKRLIKAVQEQFTKGDGQKAKGIMGKESKSWIEKIKDSIKEKIPLIVEKAKELIIGFINGLIKHAKTIGQKGAELVARLIDGIASRIGGIVEAAVDLIVNFAEALGNNLHRIVNAGIQLIADFLHALADGIRNGSKAIGGGLKDVIDAMKDVGKDLIQGIIDGVGSMLSGALGSIGNLASSMVDKAKGIFGMKSPSKVFAAIGVFLVKGLTQGIQSHAASAITSVASMVSGQIAMATGLIHGFIQKLDQTAIAATAKAVGLQAAANKAAQAADAAEKRASKTKGTGDDRKARKARAKANQIQKNAERAATAAEKRQAKVDEAIAAQERSDLYNESDTFTKAKMRSEDAQTKIEEAKANEMEAAAKLREADALDKMAKAPGLNKAERKKLKKQADAARAAAKRLAEAANTSLLAAKTAASEALDLQNLAGQEAAAEFERLYREEAQADADEKAYQKLSEEEKAKHRRAQAEAMQAKADAKLAEAKEKAYTDLELANELAEEAMRQAEQARNWLADAESIEKAIEDAKKAGADSQSGTTGGNVVNLDPTEAAALAFSRYNDLFNSATAAAAAAQHVEFNQYNSSPEALSPAELYRQTNNQLSYAVQKLEPSAA